MGHAHFDFTGEVAIVTGGASGIGRAIVEALANAGARVHAFDKHFDSGIAGAVVCHTVDLKDPHAPAKLALRVLALEGRIDHLVNNAGITRDAVLWKLEDAAWDEVLDVNLGASFRMLRAVVPPMRQRGKGRIVQIASINGLRGKLGQANYSASKAGVIALTRTAARELGHFGITVNAIAPGLIETPMTAGLPLEVRERAKNETASGRLGQPTDVASAVLFLLSEAAAHITGTVLPVDGGQLA